MKTQETQIYDEAGERIIPGVEAGIYYMGEPYHVVGINDKGRARVYPWRPQPGAKEGQPYRGQPYRGQVSALREVPGAKYGMPNDAAYARIVEDLGGTFAERTGTFALLDSLQGELQELFAGAESADGVPPAAGTYDLRLLGDYKTTIPGVGRRHVLTGTHLWRVERGLGDTETQPVRRVSRTPEMDDLLRRCHAALEAKLAYTPNFEEGSVSARMLADWLGEMRETFAGLEKHLGVRAPEETIARLMGEGDEKTERRSA